MLYYIHKKKGRRRCMSNKKKKIFLHFPSPSDLGLLSFPRLSTNGLMHWPLPGLDHWPGERKGGIINTCCPKCGSTFFEWGTPKGSYCDPHSLALPLPPPHCEIILPLLLILMYRVPPAINRSHGTLNQEVEYSCKFFHLSQAPWGAQPPSPPTPASVT